jgi:hypothetical protein
VCAALLGIKSKRSTQSQSTHQLFLSAFPPGYMRARRLFDPDLSFCSPCGCRVTTVLGPCIALLKPLFPSDPSFLPQAAKSTPVAESKPQTPLPPDWVEGVDPASGVPYYFHTPTGKSQWERPAPPASRSEGAALPPPPPPPKLPALPAGWKEAVDSESGKKSDTARTCTGVGKAFRSVPYLLSRVYIRARCWLTASDLLFGFCLVLLLPPPRLVSCPLREQRR